MCKEHDDEPKVEKSPVKPESPVPSPPPQPKKKEEEFSSSSTSLQESFKRKSPAPNWLTPDITTQNPAPLVYANEPFGRNPLLLSSSDGLLVNDDAVYFPDTCDSSVDEKIDRMPI
ncbi:hypothetical protein TVAG_467790 [Trichomonas vaginalis G3]|uniref:Uncharacterized protein n=1 Tax=Trichomonas vaginalis (strain ATCC PRA-98 / G3) TaxID=412133 RepID=A2E0L9_TRIV3|nr:hypothetical protein TVAGG3_0074090 [Trichomonas vaginalis G3]EAX70915.1 hypothetical protein TVAG_268560 [Trichomonas vaginalis G3]EAY13764.1 hypothetical protein TVAG_467790 [Trichomonas vaginalis G3]KAI5542720.1 hypothetical protein TVAGG3_0074090 [Trichomonas vaginalis G3]|eukprot:XP_001283845.1 hypothetical protein [Trichomonas vaginalis G3]